MEHKVLVFVLSKYETSNEKYRQELSLIRHFLNGFALSKLEEGRLQIYKKIGLNKDNWNDLMVITEDEELIFLPLVTDCNGNLNKNNSTFDMNFGKSIRNVFLNKILKRKKHISSYDHPNINLKSKVTSLNETVCKRSKKYTEILLNGKEERKLFLKYILEKTLYKLKQDSLVK